MFLGFWMFGRLIQRATALKLIGHSIEIQSITVVVTTLILASVALGLMHGPNLSGKPRARELLDVIESYDEMTVLMHLDPDPDAMSCAIGIQQLGESVNTDIEMVYPGGIRHQENEAFESILDVDFTKFEHADEIETDGTILVDHHKPRGFEQAETISPDVIVDHHPGAKDEYNTSFSHIDSTVGACATLIAEYFETLGWNSGDTSDSNTQLEQQTLDDFVATGLSYGILADTNHLTKSCSEREFDAVTYLYDGTNQDWIERISSSDVTEEILDARASAISNRQVQDGFAISDIGELNNRDAIPQAADELLRLEDVESVVVIASCDGELHFSGRSRSTHIHIGNALREAVNGIPSAGAGGHAHMAGGQVVMEDDRVAGMPDMSRQQFFDHLLRTMHSDKKAAEFD